MKTPDSLAPSPPTPLPRAGEGSVVADDASTIAARPLDGYFFEDYRLGQHFIHATPRTITAGDSALYLALTGARQPLHCSLPVAQALGYRDMPIDDLLVFNIAFGKTVPDISYNAIANLGYADVRFLAPVYVGDTLRSETQIIGLKENSSGKSGVVYVRSDTFRQDGEKVLTWARWVMINKREISKLAPAAASEKTLPDLPAFVTAENIVAPKQLRPAGLNAQSSGSTRLWDDYVAGQVIDHPAGMTLDESQHTLATRLYQNTARVHFDAHHMATTPFGKRLVYGGHVISICRALSYDGLENVISIAAINAGSHVHPTFAGDTLYAKTQVLGAWALRPDLGALRLRLLGLKNLTAGEYALPADIAVPQLVLDLDYTVLMPRK